MRSISIFLIVLFGFTTVSKNQKGKILPVYIELSDSALNKSGLLLNIKAAFGTRKIKTISKDDASAYIKTEAARVSEEFHRGGGNLANFDQFKAYLSTNSQYVVNMLLIKIKVDSNNTIEDTIRWNNQAAPMNFSNPPKKNTRFIVLDSSNSTSLIKFSQSLVDSIIASNVLLKE